MPTGILQYHLEICPSHIHLSVIYPRKMPSSGPSVIFPNPVLVRQVFLLQRLFDVENANLGGQSLIQHFCSKSVMS